jgi:tetraacyldisaccharide 4'-kinase
MGFLRALLFPFAILYGLGVRFRNFLYDTGFLRSREFGIPLISVGNLSTGGTGKTPHIEHFLELLQATEHRAAVLSRGYKRQSSGYKEAKNPPDSKRIGDEPAQIKRHFPETLVAVSKDRGKGIRKIKEEHEGTDVVLLDDAFQHRSVNTGMNVLLTAYENLYIEDHLLPMGRLREPSSGAKRADLIIVTKCPKEMQPLDRRIIMYKLDPLDHQEVYFSYIEYGDPYPVFLKSESVEFPSDHHYIVITGIEDPAPLHEHIAGKEVSMETIQRPDHHRFGEKDLRQLKRSISRAGSRKVVVLTTEKDAARMKGSSSADRFAELPIYAVPMKVKVHGEEEQDRLGQILAKHVREDQRNDRIHSE